MKNLILFTLSILFLQVVYSQSDNCATATFIDVSSGTACVNGTTSGSTSDLITTTCNPSEVNEVWYVFNMAGTQNTVTVTPQGGSSIEDLVVVLDASGCGDALIDFCDNGMGTNAVTQLISGNPGDQVIVSVGSTSGIDGDFEICLQSVTPTNPTDGDECENALPLCDPGTTIDVPDMSIYTGSSKPSCFIGPGSNPTQDVFIAFTAYDNGTIAWTGNPDNGFTEYDWALYDVSGGCLGTLEECNYNYTSQTGQNFGMGGPGTGEFNPAINATAGNTYVVYISNWSGNGTGFDFNFTGTATLSPIVDFSLSPSGTMCGASVTVGITDNSTASVEWTFGNGNTFSGNNPPDQTFVATGTYEVTGVINGACPATMTEYVTVIDTMIVTPYFVDASCGNCDGIAGVNVSNGSGDYSFSWGGPNTDPSLTNLCAGDYTVTVTDNVCGSSQNHTITVGSAAAIVLDPIADTSVCVSYVLPNISGTTLTGSQEYNTQADGLGTSFAEGATINYADFPSYPVTLYAFDDDGGCAVNEPFALTINTIPVLTLQDTTGCPGFAVDLTNTSVWSTDVGTLTFYADPGLTNPVGTPTSAGAGTYYAQADNAGCTASGTVTISEFTPPVIVAIGDDPNTCNATDGFIEVTLSSGPTSSGILDWTGTASGSNGSADITADTPDITGLGAGSYDVTFTDANGCVSNTEPVTLLNTEAPIIDVILDTTGCTDYTLDLTSVTGTNLTGALSFYSETGGPSGAGVLIPDGTTFTAFTDTIIYVYDANGTCSDEIQYNVTINTTPTLTLQDTTGCVGFTVDLTNTSVWSTDVGTLTFYTDPGHTTPVGTPTSAGAGTYYAQADNAGCTASGTVTVSEFTPPVIVAVGDDPNVCNGTDGSIEVTLSSGATSSGTLDWNGTASGSNGSADVTVDSPDITSLGAGSYDVTFTDANGCVSNMESVNLSNPNAPIIDVLTPLIGCDSVQLPGITGTDLTASVGYWTGIGATGTSLNVGDWVTTSTTIYAYDSTNANPACWDEEPLQITVNLTPELDPIADVTSCGTYDLPVQISGTNLTGGEAYFNDLQLNGGTAISGTLSTSQTVYVYDDNNGCSDEISFLVTIEEFDDASFALEDYCQGDANIATIIGVSGGTFAFDPPASDGASIDGATGVITDGVGGSTYSVVYITNGNCSSSSIETVTVYALPEAPTMTGDGVFCTNSDIPAMTATGSGGILTWYDSPALSNSIGTGGTMQPVETIGVAEYYVEETSTQGCIGPVSSLIIEIEGCDILVPTAFTPNNDMVHDDWEIVNLDLVYPKSVVSVFNRWGSLVFQHNSETDGFYDNNRWDGTYNGQLLPVASYYYIIDFNNDERGSQTGSVTIIIND